MLKLLVIVLAAGPPFYLGYIHLGSQYAALCGVIVGVAVLAAQSRADGIIRSLLSGTFLGLALAMPMYFAGWLVAPQ